MEDLISLLVLLAIVYFAIEIILYLLLKNLYKSKLVYATKFKETHTPPSYYESSGHFKSYFKYVNEKQEEKTLTTGSYTNLKKGKSKYLFYNEETKEATKVYTIVWETLLLILNLYFSFTVGIPFFILAIVLIIITIYFYSKHYKNKILKIRKRKL